MEEANRMYNHAPQNYICPLCLAVSGIENENTMMKQNDIFYCDDLVMAIINSKFINNNKGHVIVVPLKHYENIYELPESESNRVIKIAKEVAIAMKKVRNADGVMLVQNNEPASSQHAFHFHLHAFPRFNNDDLENNLLTAAFAKPYDRIQFAEKMKDYFLNINV